MKITVANDLELTLRAVSQVAIDEIIDDLGGYELQWRLSEMDDAQLREHFAGYRQDELDAYLKVQHRQMLYCFGWGVVEAPPDDALTVLDLLGCNHAIPQIQRANWLVYAANLTRGDKARIIGGVMALTYADELRRMANGD